jgi:hypothetical protein
MADLSGFLPEEAGESVGAAGKRVSVVVTADLGDNAFICSELQFQAAFCKMPFSVPGQLQVGISRNRMSGRTRKSVIQSAVAR